MTVIILMVTMMMLIRRQVIKNMTRNLKKQGTHHYIEHFA